MSLLRVKWLTTEGQPTELQAERWPVKSKIRRHRRLGWGGIFAALFLLSSPVAAQESAEASGETSPSVESAKPAQAQAVMVDLLNAKMPWDHILVGGQPTREQLAEVAAAGYGTVINLRSPGELEEWDEEAVVGSLGMRYVSIPVSGQRELTEETARQLAKHLEAAGDQPVLVHCASGNRVGAIFALKAFFLDGEPAEEAMAIGERSGLRSLAPMVEAVLSGKASP